MKNIILVFLLGIVSVLTFPEATAQLIDVMDNPSEITSVTSYEGSQKMQTLKVINFVLFGLGGILTLVAPVGFLVGLIMVCFKSSRKAGKKVLIFSGIGLFLIVLILVGFALVNTFMAAGVSTNRPLL